MIRSLSAILAASLCAATVSAQNPPFNVTQVSNFDQVGQTYADVWAEGNIAFLAHQNQNRIDLIDISTPASPSLAFSATATKEVA